LRTSAVAENSDGALYCAKKIHFCSSAADPTPVSGTRTGSQDLRKCGSLGSFRENTGRATKRSTAGRDAGFLRSARTITCSVSSQVPAPRGGEEDMGTKKEQDPLQKGK
jgi:hypothetical protein